jgi:hypothetical protein
MTSLGIASKESGFGTATCEIEMSLSRIIEPAAMSETIETAGVLADARVNMV